ncbi:MAG TPA: glycosyltransferase family 2 protein [Acidimicrobiales bacterium]|nr:glycosyltransferase family 2 protein [Acidimicrobiales bacterium]
MPETPDDQAADVAPSGPAAEVDHRSELVELRETVRAFELTSAHNEMVAEQFRQLGRSRLFPLAVLLLKADNVAERLIRRSLGREVAVPPPLADGPPAPRARAAATLGKGLRLLTHALRVLVRGRSAAGPAGQVEADPYGQWNQAFARFDDELRRRLTQRVDLLVHRPKFSVVMSAYNTDRRFLAEAIDSVLGQIYPDFELVIADDASSDPGVAEVVAAAAARDPRVRYVRRDANGGIAAATNSAIEAARHEWLVFMDHDDTLAPWALLHVALTIAHHPGAQLLYSAEDKLDERGRLFMPSFKSDFDPVLLLGQNYVCHLTTVRRELVERLGGLRSEFDGSQDWDLVLRVAEVVDRADVVHIPLVLYHWRSHRDSTSMTSAAKPWALDAGRRAVAAALARRGVDARVEEVEGTGFARVRYALPADPPLVSVLVPTRDGKYLERCLESLLARTTYPNFEVVVIDNGSVEEGTRRLLARLSERVRVHRDDREFNYSALHNAAVPACRGTVLALLNDDTEVIDGDWLTHLVAHLLQPGVGAVGAKLVYPDGRVQHAGVVLGPNALAGHVGQFSPRADHGYFGRTSIASEFQAVTFACVAVRRATWERLGGLDEGLKVAFNDIDFCLRVGATGERVTYTPLAELVHHESASRGDDQTGERFVRFMGEVLWMRDRWGGEILHDPYYNPNLARGHRLFELAYPPRVSPWYTGIE